MLLDMKRGEFQVNVIVKDLWRSRDPTFHLRQVIVFEGHLRSSHFVAAPHERTHPQGEKKTGIEKTEGFQTIQHGLGPGVSSQEYHDV